MTSRPPEEGDGEARANGRTRWAVALLLTALIAVGGWGLHLYEQLNRADAVCREISATQAEKLASIDARQQEVLRRLANVETESRLLAVEVAALRVMTTKGK